MVQAVSVVAPALTFPPKLSSRTHTPVSGTISHGASCMQAAGIQLGVESYTTWLAAHYKRGKWADALVILGDMKAAGVVPTTHTYTTVIAVCGEGGQWERSKALYAEMKAAGLRPDEASYQAFIQACDKMNY
jgi:pentatricopeptide repeat protein